MHFCVLTARVYGRFSCPRKIGLNWFIPALVNSSVGSSCGTTGELGTNVWPCRATKKSMNCWRIWAEVMVVKSSGSGQKSRIIHQENGCFKRREYPVVVLRYSEGS